MADQVILNGSFDSRMPFFTVPASATTTLVMLGGVVVAATTVNDAELSELTPFLSVVWIV